MVTEQVKKWQMPNSKTATKPYGSVTEQEGTGQVYVLPPISTDSHCTVTSVRLRGRQYGSRERTCQSHHLQ